jgi:phytochrome-interacting factor 4
VDFFLQESLHGRQWEIGGVPEEASQVKHFVTHIPNGILSPFYSGEPSIDPAANRSAETDLVELLWHNGGVVAQPQTHPRPAANPCGGQSASGLTGEETAAWFGDVDGLENEMYAQLWHSIADGPAPLPCPPPPPPHQAARPPMRSGIGSSWTGGGDIGSTFCGSSQVPEVPAEGREEGSAALPSEGTRGTSTRDCTATYTGTGTSSSGGSGSNFGGSGLPSESGHAHKRKGRCRDESACRSEVCFCLV